MWNTASHLSLSVGKVEEVGIFYDKRWRSRFFQSARWTEKKTLFLFSCWREDPPWTVIVFTYSEDCSRSMTGRRKVVTLSALRCNPPPHPQMTRSPKHWLIWHQFFVLGWLLPPSPLPTPRPTIPDICHKHHKRCLWRKTCHVEKFLHMTDCYVEKISTWQIVSWQNVSTW